MGLDLPKKWEGESDRGEMVIRKPLWDQEAWTLSCSFVGSHSNFDSSIPLKGKIFEGERLSGFVVVVVCLILSTLKLIFWQFWGPASTLLTDFNVKCTIGTE